MVYIFPDFHNKLKRVQKSEICPCGNSIGTVMHIIYECQLWDGALDAWKGSSTLHRS